MSHMQHDHVKTDELCLEAGLYHLIDDLRHDLLRHHSLGGAIRRERGAGDIAAANGILKIHGHKFNGQLCAVVMDPVYHAHYITHGEEGEHVHMSHRLFVLFDGRRTHAADGDNAAAAPRLGDHMLDKFLRGTGMLIGVEERRRGGSANAVLEHRIFNFQWGQQLFIFVHCENLS